MKRVLLSIASALAAVILIPAVASANAGQTDIYGQVTDGGNPVKGAKVTVTCGSKTKHDTTDAQGDYFVAFNIKNCPAGSSATVSASKKHIGSGSNGNTVPSSGNDKLNLDLINVSIPEYGLITVIGASVIGGAGFLVVRQRQISGHQA